LRAATTGNIGAECRGHGICRFDDIRTEREKGRVREVASYLRYLLSKSKVDILKMFIAPSWRAFYDAIRVKEQFLLTLHYLLPPLPSVPFLVAVWSGRGRGSFLSCHLHTAVDANDDVTGLRLLGGHGKLSQGCALLEYCTGKPLVRLWDAFTD